MTLDYSLLCQMVVRQTLLEGHRSRMRAVEMGYLRSTCESFAGTDGQIVKRQCNVGVDVTRSSERHWSAHVEQMECKDMSKG